MSYLVDGNNLMAQRVGWHLDKRAARRGLLDELAAHVARVRIKLTVVFDGAPDEFFPDGARYKGVVVCYASKNSDADTRIKELVEASRERRTLHVVTSDRALGDYVKRCGAQIVRCKDFRARMQDASERTGERGNANQQDAHAVVKPQEMNEWMRYFGVAPEDEDVGKG